MSEVGSNCGGDLVADVVGRSPTKQEPGRCWHGLSIWLLAGKSCPILHQLVVGDPELI